MADAFAAGDLSEQVRRWWPFAARDDAGQLTVHGFGRAQDLIAVGEGQVNTHIAAAVRFADSNGNLQEMDSHLAGAVGRFTGFDTGDGVLHLPDAGAPDALWAGKDVAHRRRPLPLDRVAHAP